MNIIVVLTLVVCLLGESVAVRLRENSNVLVPNNDVNRHAVKKLLNGDEVDPKDLSENEIENVKNQKIVKLFKKRLLKANKVFDDKNRNVEENKIDRDVTEMFVGNFGALSKLYIVSPTPKWPRDESTTVEYNETTFVMATTSSTEMSNSTTFPASTIPTGTSTVPPLVLETTTVQSYTTTGNTTAESVSTSLSSTIAEDPTSTTPSSERIYDDVQGDECILGKAERRLEWLTKLGALNEVFIHSELGFVHLRDLSRTFNSQNPYENFSSNLSKSLQLRNNFTVRFLMTNESLIKTSSIDALIALSKIFVVHSVPYQHGNLPLINVSYTRVHLK